MNDLKDCFGNAKSTVSKIYGTGKNSIAENIESLPRYLVFSTPGHKGELSKTDITEYDGGDIFPRNSVELAQEKTAKRYGAKWARYSVGGSSMAIKSAIVAVDSDIVAPSFTHRCVIEGVKLIKKKAYFIDTQIQDGLPNLPTKDQYERALNAHPSVKLAVVTSPDYFGRVADIKGIKEACNERGVMLLVDSAHGAHYATRPDIFPDCAVKLADFSAVSTHKTLHSLTQTAIGFCNNDEYANKWMEAFELLGTTSPSYELLASIENGLAYEDEHKDYYDEIARFRYRLNEEFDLLDNDDIARVVIRSCDGKGKTLFDELIKRNIMPETYYEEYCVLILTLADGQEKLDALYGALKDMDL